MAKPWCFDDLRESEVRIGEAEREVGLPGHQVEGFEVHSSACNAEVATRRA